MADFRKYETKELKQLHKVEIEMLKDINKICKKYKISYFALDGTGIGALRHKGFIPWDDDIDLRFIREDAYKFRECVEKEMGDKYYFIDRNNSKLPITFMKMCKKNTIFQDDDAYLLNEEVGIFVDIFPMDYVSDDKKTREKQLGKSWYLFKLGTLACIKSPVIACHGLKEKFYLFICTIMHYLLNILGLTGNRLFNKGEKIVDRNKKTNTIASLNTVKKNTSIFDINDIFPVRKVPFEDTYVYVPKNAEKLLNEYFGDFMKLPPERDRHNHFPRKLIFDTRKVDINEKND
ncbi:MAG: phosphorylcholine transferase LicD [Bacilli bacterium]